ncbi:MAG TPA: hypothetical protein VEK08_16650 [Planctomycetota bacterium]|nr:hypothetical protein [Planctomycetota bacterium]
MPWEAHNIFIEPTSEAIRCIKNEPELSKELYHVTDLEGFDWPETKFCHGLPPRGLLVVRLRTGNWGAEPCFWRIARDYPDEELQLTSEAFAPLLEENEYAQFPPPLVLRFLKNLQRTSKTSIAYYHCFMWGGTPENEYAFVFAPDEIAYVGLPGKESQICCITGGTSVRRDGDVLVEALKHLGVFLPTPYFALHTGYFEWQRYQS